MSVTSGLRGDPVDDQAQAELESLLLPIRAAQHVNSGLAGQRREVREIARRQLGGRILMDDLTPVRTLPAGSPFLDQDGKRDLFAGEPRLVWTEVVLPDLANSLLVGSRI